ncbi:MAG TPA: LuxR C-terminal-related transcriptional regulator, partial [Anaerolineales bacterium]
AHREAAAHYKTALRYAGMLPAEKRAELLDSYSDECDLIENTTEAKRAQEEALRLWRELGKREREGRAFRRLSEIAFTLSQKLEAEHDLDEAITLLEVLPPAKELAMTYSLKSRLHLYADQFDETIYWGSRAIELAERLRDLETLAHGLTNIGMVEMKHGKQAEGQTKLERSLQLSLAHGFHSHAARAFIDLGVGLSYFRDYKTATRYFDEALAYCAQYDLDYWRTVALGNRALYYIEQGKWAEAEKDILAAENTWRTPIEDVTRARLWLQVRRDGSLSTKELTTAVLLKRDSPLFETAFLVAGLLAEAAWLKEDLTQCRAEAESMFQIACERNLPKQIGYLSYWMWRAGAIAQPPPNAAEPYVMQMAGNWSAAAALWEKYGCPYEQAMALMDGDETAQLTALEIFERLGARPIMEKLRQKMRTEGVRGIPRGPRPTTRENPFGLTSREMEVLACLAKGLSNNAIAKQLSLSARTVEHHTASILQKMGVGSRNEAVALAMKDNLLS